MITEKRRVLVNDNPTLCSHLSHFEAITCLPVEDKVSLLQRCQKVWSYNKTPLICTENVDDVTFEDSDLKLVIPNDLVLAYQKYDESEYFLSEGQVKVFTNWCYDEGFEPGEYDTGKRINTRNETCILCQIAKHKAIADDTVDYNTEVENEVDCIIYESRRFYVVTELGALKPGYLMIVPKSHEYLSIAQIDDDYVYQEYCTVCRDVELILKGAFGPTLPVAFIEHGSGPSGMTSHPKSIVHAHTHVVVGFTLEQKYLDMVQMKPLPDIRKAKDTHYFAYKVGSDGERLCCYNPEVYVQRQYPRQIMAMQYGFTMKQYNWRKYRFDDNVHATLYRIWNFLNRHRHQLTPRVYTAVESFLVGYKNRPDFRD